MSTYSAHFWPHSTSTTCSPENVFRPGVPNYRSSHLSSPMICNPPAHWHTWPYPCPIPVFGSAQTTTLSPYPSPVSACRSTEQIFGQEVIDHRMTHSLTSITQSLPTTRYSSPVPESNTGTSSPAPVLDDPPAPEPMSRSQSRREPPGSLTSTAPLVRLPSSNGSSTGLADEPLGQTSSIAKSGSFACKGMKALPTPDNTPPLGTKKGGKHMRASSDEGQEGYGEGGASKRKRVPIACNTCKHRKIRCSGEQPCAHCLKMGLKDCCKYEPYSKKKPKGERDGGRQDQEGEDGASEPGSASGSNTLQLQLGPPDERYGSLPKPMSSITMPGDGRDGMAR
ncbi:hypothetical protein IAU59_005920 [Kwoniella sp. CBS 9459]